MCFVHFQNTGRLKVVNVEYLEIRWFIHAKRPRDKLVDLVMINIKISQFDYSKIITIIAKRSISM